MDDAADRGAGGTLHPRLHLDELLAQLQEQIAAVVDVRDRMHQLLDAVVSVGGGLDLSEVLDRIVRAAVDLVEARYGALGVLDAQGLGLVEFRYVGITEEEADRIGPLPSGHGILGLLIKDPRPLRLRDIQQHPESYGFPPNHPPMRNFLGVPVRVRGQVFGNLYLTEKKTGEEFDEADENIVTALASAAGVAVENARLYEASQLGERWRKASSEVVYVLLSGAETPEVLELIADRARELADATQANVLLPDDTGNALKIVAAAGEDAKKLTGTSTPVDDGRAGAVYRSGVAESWATDEGATNLRLSKVVDVGPRLLVPLGETGQTRGVLVLYNRPNRSFSPYVLETLTAFAEQAAVALELSERRRDAEQLAIYQDRERIARNLHDLVIQRLFATGMGIESANRLMSVDMKTASERMERSVADIDATIREIRSVIFALQNPAGSQERLRSRVLEVVSESASALGFEPTVHFDGLVDTMVDDDVAEHLLAVLREGLANVARHAGAGSVEVKVAVGDDVLLEIRDDGKGIPESGRRSGLVNMTERAAELGGTFTTTQVNPGTSRPGTLLAWQVPLTQST